MDPLIMRGIERIMVVIGAIAFAYLGPRAAPGTRAPRRILPDSLSSPPASGSVPGADRSPLPSSPAHTPQCSDLPARSEKNGPVRPHSQDERSPVGQRSPGIDPLTRSWVLSGPGKKVFYNSYSHSLLHIIEKMA